MNEGKNKLFHIIEHKAIANAKNELGEIESIRNTFIEFQELLYKGDVG